MNENTTIIGYYGKIPSKGDFISQSLPRSFTEPWDNWLREVLAHGKKELGNDWMEHYLTTPLYQYALSPGICGAQTWLGIMMPSVDRVGRYFPMTICKSFSTSCNPLKLLESNHQWFEKAESLLLSCLDDDFSFEDFEQGIRELKDDEDDDSTITLKTASMNRYQDSAWNFPVHESEKLANVYPELVNSLMSTFYLTYSVWHTYGSESIPPGFVLSEGLPPYKSVIAFMDGKWGDRGWSDEQIIR